jgi:hypothetical protein
MRVMQSWWLGWGTALVPALALAQSTTFDMALTTSIDGRPAAVVVANVDGDPDGFLDAVTANADSASISVVVGDGSGFLFTLGKFDAGTVPMGLALADFDADGNLDAAVSNANVATVTIIKGLGDGSFDSPLAPIDLPGLCTGDPAMACNPDLPPEQDTCILAQAGTCNAVAGPGSLAARDLNGDGIADLAVASEGNGDGDGKVSFLFGVGDGTFTAVVPRAAGSKTSALVIDDVNGDSKPDVVVANTSSNTVSAFLGDGAGNFQPRRDSSVGEAQPGKPAAPVALAAGEVTGDGRIDLVVATPFGVTLLRGDGQGNFTSAASFEVGNTPSGVTLADINGDQRLDIVTSNSRSADATVLFGNGQGQFANGRTFVTGGEPLAVATGDFNGDDELDIITADQATQGPEVVVLLNADGERFAAVEDLPVGKAVAATVSGDFDGDGLPDLAAAFGDEASGSVRVYLARTNRTFVVGGATALSENSGSLAAADFNRDGKLDLGATAADSGAVIVLPGKGDGTFDTARTVVLPGLCSGDLSRTCDLSAPPGADICATEHVGTCTATRPVALAATDLDNDRVPDLAVISIGEPGAVVSLLNAGDGTMQPAGAAQVHTTPVALAAGRFNADAFVDLAVTNSGSNDLTILPGKGDGTFDLGVPLAVGRSPVAIASIDLNRDGKEDLAVAQATDQNVAIYSGNGSGGFALATTSPAGDTPSGVVVRDFNLDGRPDVVASNRVSNNATILQGNSSGRLTRVGSVVLSRQPESIVGPDYDGDGQYDVATGNASTAMNVSVMTNVTGRALLRGDGNGDTRVGAADLIATLRQLTDTDSGRPEDAGFGAYAANPGVDANGDGEITPQDAGATTRRIFFGG